MSSSSPVCYTISENYVTATNQYFPCTQTNGTTAASCCAAGDFCMQNSICHFTTLVTNSTGYYMAGCTDPSWQDPACPKQCTTGYAADIVYDTANEEWDCCVTAKGFLDCQQSGNRTVQAPGPGALIVLSRITQSAPSASLTGIGSVSIVTDASSSSSAAATSIPSSSATSAAAASTASQSNEAASSTVAPYANHSSGPPSGAVAGAVIGAVAFILALGLGIFFTYRRRQRQDLPIKLDSYTGFSSSHFGSQSNISRSTTFSSTNLLAELPPSPALTRVGSNPSTVRVKDVSTEKIPVEDGYFSPRFSPGFSPRPSPRLSPGFQPAQHHPAFREDGPSELAGDMRQPSELPATRGSRRGSRMR